jgi:hypothetical protein
MTILNTEYHLVRQILLLLHRKLSDISHIIRTLRSYPIEEIFSLLTKFNSPSHVKIHNTSFDPDNPGQVIENHSQFRLQNSTGKQFIPDVRGNIVEGKDFLGFFQYKINLIILGFDLFQFLYTLLDYYIFY